MSYPRLIIFTKAPYYGGAKSRLAKGIGKVHANRIYRAIVRRVIRNVADPRWDIIIAGTPDKDLHRTFNGIWPRAFPRMSQGTGSLTPRLAKAFSFKGPTLVIGTDAPQITRRDIALAFKALRRSKAVFGPADDGGFWLMGMNGPVPDNIFEDVNWSTHTALADVGCNIEGDITYLRTLIDVDDVEALRAIKANKAR